MCVLIVSWKQWSGLARKEQASRLWLHRQYMTAGARHCWFWSVHSICWQCNKRKIATSSFILRALVLVPGRVSCVTSRCPCCKIPYSSPFGYISLLTFPSPLYITFSPSHLETTPTPSEMSAFIGSIYYCSWVFCAHAKYTLKQQWKHKQIRLWVHSCTQSQVYTGSHTALHNVLMPHHHTDKQA